DISGTFTASNKTYDGNNTATVTGRGLVGVLAADAANVSLTGGTATFSDAFVANEKIVASSGMVLSGSAAANYNLTGVATTTADIT
ncbi:hemagglutination protein, partial [Flavobacterium sp. ALD4]|uniref:YDG domain-containing protein n=1 Tax=Flavobacterium sp. ALD4 TaxID=2058314 RepID=UPI000CB7FDA2